MSAPRVQLLDLADPAIARQLLEVQRAAYRVEADLIGYDGIPPLHETLEELIAFPAIWVGIVDEEGKVLAALAYRDELEGAIDIHRLVVAPRAFRRGYASALLDSLDKKSRITVSTGAANMPAHDFYLSRGFTAVGNEQVTPDLEITHFVREGYR
jgi:GNAT superfamily N-acetyltransferase